MSHIFIAYSRQDQSYAAEIVANLEATGNMVWWDRELLPGDSFRDVIIDAIDKAHKVIILWSEHSVRSEWALAEAHRGLDANKLIPICLPNLAIEQIPLPFNTLHTLLWNEAIHIGTLEKAIGLADTEIGKADPVDENASYSVRRNAGRVRTFIAHASSDKKRLSGPLSVIVDMGFKVWIDKPEELDVSPSVQKKIERIHYGQDWQARILDAVRKSDCVLAFWSQDAIKGRSQQFYYELYMGLVQQKLIQCRIDTVPVDEIGMPYTFHHIADLSKFEDSKFSLPLDQLMEDLQERRRRWLFGMLG